MQIVYAAHNDHPELVKMANRMFGNNYITLEHIRNDPYLYILAAVKPDDDFDRQVYGFCTLKVERGVGHIHEVLVHEDMRGCGLATNLIKSGIEHFRRFGVREIECQAWQRKDNNEIPLKKALEANGFSVKRFKIEAYHEPESDYECIICGRPCKCDAFIYILTLEDQPATLRV